MLQGKTSFSNVVEVLKVVRIENVAEKANKMMGYLYWNPVYFKLSLVRMRQSF